MKFSLDAEQQALDEVVQQLVRKVSSGEAEVTTEHRRHVWKVLAEDVGLGDLLSPVAAGGSGAGWVEVAVVQRRLGEGLVAGGFLAHVVAADLLLRGPATPVAAWDALGGGGLVTAALGGSTVRAEVDRGSHRLTGPLALVPEIDVADQVLVEADLAGEPHLYLVPAADLRVPGLSGGLDLSRRFATVDLSGLPTSAPVARAPGRASHAVSVALAAEALGSAEHVLRSTLDHVASREAFGRTVASFQAVKHRLAEIRARLTAGEALLWRAAWAADVADPLAPSLAAAALDWCSAASGHAARVAVQLHGGTGFTWEHEAHRYLRRALVDAAVAAHHRPLDRVLNELHVTSTIKE